MNKPISSGLYQFRGALLFDPRNARFPNRCIFTNESVVQHSLVKLANVQASGPAPLINVTKDACFARIPVSNTWRKKNTGRWLLFAAFLKFVGCVLVAGGFLLASVVGFAKDSAIGFMVVGGVFGGVILLVAFFIPRLEDTVDTNCIYRVAFMKSGLLAIPGVSKEFLSGLPEATAGFLHGFFGIDSIRLPEIDD